MYKMQPNSSRKVVYLNPNFKNTHINPNFLLSKPTPPPPSSSIHVNPVFLQRLKETKDVEPETKDSNNSAIPNLHNFKNTTTSTICPSNVANIQETKIITKSRTKIIREPMKQNALNIRNSTDPMIKINRMKLIRASAIPELQTSATPSIVKPIPVKSLISVASKLLSSRGKYKLDRRIPRRTASAYNLKVGKKASSFVSKYALKRSNVSENLSSKKLVVTNGRLLKIGSSNQLYIKGKFPLSSTSVHKKLELLNINGVLYRSTKNKLQKADSSRNVIKKINKKSIPGGRTVFIKGDRFVLDKSGKSLTRIVLPHAEKMKLKRIDIGGLTYVAKSNNLFVRTETHKTRNHLSMAKQKSINTLSKNVVKTNIPCPIYRKVGKCAAFERGKCPKVHDKKQVSICSKFLKEECTNDKCLLSHDVTLSKMPTCKFFLQGVCVRDNCPYLHKKLGEGAKICLDFLRGFCQQAEKCNKRHDFVCPDFERTGKCEKVKCIYCNKKRKATNDNNKVRRKCEQYHVKKIDVDDVEKMEIGEKSLTSRYFIDEPDKEKYENKVEYAQKKVFKDDSGGDDDNNKGDSSDELEGTVLQKRPKLGALPSFIPL